MRHRRNPLYIGADALDWDEAMELVSRLIRDFKYREAMLICAGCHLGLRISDLLSLTWNDCLSTEPITIVEQKTGKARKIRINQNLNKVAKECLDMLNIEDTTMPVFNSSRNGGRKTISRQRASQILKRISEDYGIKSAKRFSTHSLRKTFGRRVWLQECDKGKGDQALLLLCEIFGHSSVSITKRYLGIRQEEILSVYDSLS